mgnify:CR=1 FL=1
MWSTNRATTTQVLKVTLLARATAARMNQSMQPSMVKMIQNRLCMSASLPNRKAEKLAKSEKAAMTYSWKI